MRRWCSCPRVLALAAAAALVVMSSCSYVAGGAASTPNASGGSADTSRLEESTDAGYKSHQETTVLHRSETADDESLLARQRAASGSRLPDCAHACGACSPCRRVMVSFRCAESASESCPVAYRCMCRGRFFRVPSL